MKTGHIRYLYDPLSTKTKVLKIKGKLTSLIVISENQGNSEYLVEPQLFGQFYTSKTSMYLLRFEPTIMGLAVRRATIAPQSLLNDKFKTLETNFLVDFGEEYKNFQVLCILF